MVSLGCFHPSWCPHGAPIGGPQRVCGAFMVGWVRGACMMSPRWVRGGYMVHPWWVHGACMVSSSCVRGTSMVPPWWVHGISVMGPQYLHGAPMVPPWRPHAMGVRRWSMVPRWLVLGDSVWVRDAFMVFLHTAVSPSCPHHAPVVGSWCPHGGHGAFMGVRAGSMYLRGGSMAPV